MEISRLIRDQYGNQCLLVVTPSRARVLSVPLFSDVSFMLWQQ